LGEHYQML